MDGVWQMKPIKINDTMDFMKNHSIAQRCPICSCQFNKGDIVVRVATTTTYCIKFHINCAIKFSEVIKESVEKDGNKIFYENL